MKNKQILFSVFVFDDVLHDNSINDKTRPHQKITYNQTVNEWVSHSKHEKNKVKNFLDIIMFCGIKA